MVAFPRNTHVDPVNADGTTLPTDVLSGEPEHAFDERHAARQISART